LARNIDDGVVEKFISIYRSASEPPIKEACLRGLSGTSSKTAKDFLMSVAKDGSGFAHATGRVAGSLWSDPETCYDSNQARHDR
jgi:hypothetical protein